MPRKDKVEAMFNDIAGDSDKLNHIMSMDVDRSWRRKAIRKIVDREGPLQVLDLACGTGDFSIAIARKMSEGHVIGVDISQGMLDVMRQKVSRLDIPDRISMEVGDGENLRFADGTFDRVTIAFGIRNFEDKDKGLREMLRVLKPDGRAVILELSMPENSFVRKLYSLYFLHILPWFGGLVSGAKSAYRYLPASVVGFPKKAAFMGMMAIAGFTEVTHKAFTFGLCRMYTGEKPRS